METRQKILSLIVMLLVLSSCKKDQETAIDTEYPVIDLKATNAFPIQCSTVKRGEKFTFRANLSDNVALGSVGIDIHHNFDHHSHSTEVESCQPGPEKTPQKPFVLIKDFALPAGAKSHEIAQEIAVPSDVDPGDYHFMIRLTDQAGWQAIRGLSIKIL